MLHALLSHHRRRASLPDAKMNGLWNCHVMGLTSIMLHDEPGNRIRLFLTQHDHQLWREADMGNPNMTLAIHPHHCDVTLVRVFGTVRNDIYRLRQRENGPLHECRYQSAILTGTGRLVPTGDRYVVTDVRHEYITSRYGREMLAHQMHSIYVPKGQMACWLVIEGKENPDYEPVCYTANPAFDSAGMYLPMSKSQITDTLTTILSHVRDSLEGITG